MPYWLPALPFSASEQPNPATAAYVQFVHDIARDPLQARPAWYCCYCLALFWHCLVLLGTAACRLPFPIHPPSLTRCIPPPPPCLPACLILCAGGGRHCGRHGALPAPLRLPGLPAGAGLPLCRPRVHRWWAGAWACAWACVGGWAAGRLGGCYAREGYCRRQWLGMPGMPPSLASAMSGRSGGGGQRRQQQRQQQQASTLTTCPAPPCLPCPALLSAEWVRSYSSAEYLRLPAKAESVLDETADSEPFGEWVLKQGRVSERVSCG